MISCTISLNILRDRGKSPKHTRRIPVDDLLECIAIHLREETTVGVFLELCIGPGTVDDKEKSFPIRGSTHVTLKLVRPKSVPSSSQLPGSTGQRGRQTFDMFVTRDEWDIGDAALQYQLLWRGFEERSVCSREPGKVSGLCFNSQLGSMDQGSHDKPPSKKGPLATRSRLPSTSGKVPVVGTPKCL